MIIAHISDLHVMAIHRTNPLQWLNKRLIGAVNLLLRRMAEFPAYVLDSLIDDLNQLRPDHLIVSGDLSNLSFPSEFEAALSNLRRLVLPATEVTVIPGNHDCYTASAQRKDDFGRIFAPFFKGDLNTNGQGLSAFPMVRLRGDVAIIGLSTAVPSAPLMATGILGPQQMQLTESLLQHEEVRRRFRLVVLHHPPRLPQKEWHKRLLDADEFAAMIERTGADLIIHGHLHRLVREELAGPAGVKVPIIGVNSSTWLSPKNPQRRAGYHLYDIGSSGIAGAHPFTMRCRRYDVDGKCFVDV